MSPGPAGIPQLEYLFSRIICIIVPLGFTALLVILVWAGIKYLTSAGEPKAVQSAHQTVTWGLLGVVFLAIAWLILQLIQNFTGIEVAKFTLSSLPGVEGFKGSCFNNGPIAPNIEPLAPRPESAASTPTLPQNTSNSKNPPITSLVANSCGNSTIKNFTYNDCRTINLPNMNLPSQVCMLNEKQQNIICSNFDDYFAPLPEDLTASILAKFHPEIELEGNNQIILGRILNSLVQARKNNEQMYYLNKRVCSGGGGVNNYANLKDEEGIAHKFLIPMEGKTFYDEPLIPYPSHEILWSLINSDWNFPNSASNPGIMFIRYPTGHLPIDALEQKITRGLENQDEACKKFGCLEPGKPGIGEKEQYSDKLTPFGRLYYTVVNYILWGFSCKGYDYYSVNSLFNEKQFFNR